MFSYKHLIDSIEHSLYRMNWPVPARGNHRYQISKYRYSSNERISYLKRLYILVAFEYEYVFHIDHNYYILEIINVYPVSYTAIIITITDIVQYYTVTVIISSKYITSSITSSINSSITSIPADISL